MIHSTPFSELVRGVFKPTPRGVVGLVDDLLVLCRAHQLRFHFQDGHCRIGPLGAEVENSLEVPISKSVFRAVLARIAALCNEHHPGSVTPYRGEGEIVVPTPIPGNGDSPSTCYVEFANTLSDQRLDVRSSKCSFADESRFTVLLRDNSTITVFGQTLKYVPTTSASTGYGVYKILSHIGGKRVVVALFPCLEVKGVFSGDIRQAQIP